MQSPYSFNLLYLMRMPFLRRLFRSLLVSGGVVCIAFVLVRLVPGDPVVLLLGELATEENVAELRKVMGLEGTIFQQFISYTSNLARGNLGTSIVTGQPVTTFVALTLPVTLWLLGLSFAMAIVLAIPLGVLAALYRGNWFGHFFRLTTSVFLSTPIFFSGLLAIMLFSITLGLAPVAGYDYSFPSNLRYLWLPALVNCGVIVPILSRVLQSSIVDTLDQEFVETAVVRGLPRRVFVWRYLVRPSIAPTVGLISYMMGQGLGGSVVTEMVFNIPGIGTMLINAVLRRDYTLIQGIIFVFGMIVVVFSYLSDVMSGWLDPRTKTT